MTGIEQAARDLATAYQAAVGRRRQALKRAHPSMARLQETADRLNQLEPDIAALLVGLGLKFLGNESIARAAASKPDTGGARWRKKHVAPSVPDATSV